MEKIEKTCTVCDQPFTIQASLAAQWKRCQSCRESGRTRCTSCQKKIQIPLGGGATRARCTDCGQVTVKCRGFAPFGGVPRHAARCQDTYTSTIAKLRPLDSYDQNTGTFVSSPCAKASNVIAAQLERFRKAGVKERVRSWPQYKEIQRILANELPEWRRQKGKKGVESLALTKARREGRGGGLRGEHGRHVRMAAAWKHGTRWELDLCRGCNKLVMRSTSAKARDVRFHRSCWEATLRTPEGRLWWGRRLKSKRAGNNTEQVDERFGPHIPMQSRPGRPTSADTLTRDFGWTVRHLLGGEAQIVLGKETGVTREAVSQAIKGIVTKLPDPSIADRHFRLYVEALQSIDHAA